MNNRTTWPLLSLGVCVALVVSASSLPVSARVAPASVPPTVATTGEALRASLGIYAQIRETCFLKGEKTDGMNKICFYSCPSGEAAITVGAVSLCPLSIQK